MSVFFGEIRQLGYVVPDIEAAMDYWSRVLGVGPFFYAERVPVVNFTYRGAPSSPVTSVALANSGPVQVELIQQRNDAPTMYRDFVQAKGSGLQHVAYWTQNFDADMARLAAAASRSAWAARSARAGASSTSRPSTIRAR